jgi:hypothetical protein
MIHPRVQLVTAEVVATMRGVSRETVYAWADGGFGDESFLWVFNVASRTSERELRFWKTEIETPAATRRLALNAVVAQIVPRREALPGQFCGLPNWQVGDLLRLSRQQLLNLREELGAVPHNGGIYVPRANLEQFFIRRWCYQNHAPLQPRLV